jgi:hypothetical protein
LTSSTTSIIDNRQQIRAAAGLWEYIANIHPAFRMMTSVHLEYTPLTTYLLQHSPTFFLTVPAAVSSARTFTLNVNAKRQLEVIESDKGKYSTQNHRILTSFP